MGKLSTMVTLDLKENDTPATAQDPCLQQSFAMEGIGMADVLKSMASTWIDIEEQDGILEAEVDEYISQIWMVEEVGRGTRR